MRGRLLALCYLCREVEEKSTRSATGLEIMGIIEILPFMIR
jgi:hypothetical protein